MRNKSAKYPKEIRNFYIISREYFDTKLVNLVLVFLPGKQIRG